MPDAPGTGEMRRTRRRFPRPRAQVVDVLHPGKPPVSKDDLRTHVAKLHKADKKQVILYGFKTDFGGGHSTGFGLIYDSVDDIKKFEPKYRCD